MKNLIVLVIASMLIMACKTHNAQIAIVDAFPSLSFTLPVDIQTANDGTNRLFVLTQPGKIYVFENDEEVKSSSLFLDIEDKVIDGGERGLLGLAFHNNYKQNGYFYVNYTTGSPLITRISRFQASPNNPDLALRESEFVILEVEQPYNNHNGGQTTFGPDGYLYISLGDGGSGGDPQNFAQRLNTLLGKIIRINIDETSESMNYSIPSDNPFSGNTSGFKQEIFAYGLRNVWRFSFDGNGRLWAGDVGQNKWEEIHLIEKGKNYGWRIIEGSHCYNPPSGCNKEGLELPVWEYPHTNVGGYSITGGFVYEGNLVQSLKGKYIYGDFISGNIWALNYENEKPENSLLASTNYAISTFGIDANRELFFASYSNGKIYKFKEGAAGADHGSITPQKYRLEQNYPNPFNPETTISFSLPHSGYAKVEIFDSLGRKLKILHEGFTSPGNHNLTWNGDRASSGIYFYNLIAGDFFDVRKMVLIR